MSRASAVIRPLDTERSRDLAIRALAVSAFSWERAASTTSYPALAKTSAMPEAMVPEPATPTERTSRPPPLSAEVSGVSASRTTSSEPGAAYV